MNKVIISGNITKDIELKANTSGTHFANFTVAVKRNAEKTDFIDCVAFNKTAEFVAQHFGKGKGIIVCGALNIDEYTDNTGNKRRAVKIAVESVDFAGGTNTAQNKEDALASQKNGISVQPNYTQVPTDENLPF